MNGDPMLIRAVRGPLILITIGVLFAIDHAGGMPFDRTWPALIIVIGVLKLAERAFAPNYVPPQYPTAPAGGPQYPSSGPTWTPQQPRYQPAPPPPSGSVPPSAGAPPAGGTQ